MSRIDPELLEKLKAKLEVGPAAVYSHIQRAANKYMLERPEAALALAADLNLNISRYATREQRIQIAAARSGGGRVAATEGIARPQPAQGRRVGGRRTAAPRRAAKGREKSVFVVHGRDKKKTQAMFSFLRALHLQPIEWDKARALTKKPNPYIGEILDAAFARAAAVVVLMTPDDEAQLREPLRADDDEPFEATLRGQPRQNVLFEAGAAMAKFPAQTVFVSVGRLRPFSDVSGRHFVKMDGAAAARKELATRLKDAGLDVDTGGSDWLSEGDFA